MNVKNQFVHTSSCHYVPSFGMLMKCATNGVQILNKQTAQVIYESLNISVVAGMNLYIPLN